MDNIQHPQNKPSLFIVGTPIGNMLDMSPRAVNILQNCDLILAEDTRHSIYLLKKFNINTPLKSYHQHNEKQRSREIIDALLEGKSIALISDAGMPTISDPGYTLVKTAYDNNFTASVIPGPCAIVSAIAISGIDCSSFCFAGFLPSKQGQRLNQLEYLKSLNQALVIYEAPHRLIDCISDISNVFGKQANISVVKEITKHFEHVYHGCIADVYTTLSSLDSIKGEYVIVIEGSSNDDNLSKQDFEILSALKLFSDEKIKLKQSVKLVSKLLDVPKNAVYDLAVHSNYFN